MDVPALENINRCIRVINLGTQSWRYNSYKIEYSFYLKWQIGKLETDFFLIEYTIFMYATSVNAFKFKITILLHYEFIETRCYSRVVVRACVPAENQLNENIKTINGL